MKKNKNRSWFISLMALSLYCTQVIGLNIPSVSVPSNTVEAATPDEFAPFAWGYFVTPDGPTNLNATIYMNVADVDSGIKRTKLPNGTYVTAASFTYPVTSNGDYTFTIEDLSGNITNHVINVSNIDKTNPAVDQLHISKELDGTYTIMVRASDNNEIESVLLDSNEIVHTGQNGVYQMKKLTTKPTAVTVKDRAKNSSGNVTFLGLPTYTLNTSNPVSAALSMNGSNNLIYKVGYVSHSCSSKPCVASVNENATVSVTNEAGFKTSSLKFDINNLGSTKTNLTLKAVRDATNPKKLQFTWSRSLSSGTLVCKTPEGNKSYSVTGTSYTLTLKNYSYECSLSGKDTSNQLLQSNMIKLDANYNSSVDFVKSTDAMTKITFSSSMDIVKEKNSIEEFYIINGSKNNTKTSEKVVPVPRI